MRNNIRNDNGIDPKLKAKVAVEAIRGEKSLEHLCTTYCVHPKMVRTWKKRFLEKLCVLKGMEEFFMDEAQIGKKF